MLRTRFIVSPPHPRAGRLALAGLIVGLACVIATAQTPSSAANKQPPPDPNAAHHILGLEGVSRGAGGTLKVSPSGLSFGNKHSKGEIPLASIQDVFTTQDSHQAGGTAFAVLRMGVPYGGGRVLSLLAHEKIDSLTVQYRDNNGGLHNAIFTVAEGRAPSFKKQLVDAGVHTSIPVDTKSEKEVGGKKQ